MGSSEIGTAEAPAGRRQCTVVRPEMLACSAVTPAPDLTCALSYLRCCEEALVGAGRFERPTPCAQDIEAFRMLALISLGELMGYSEIVYMVKMSL